MKTHLMIVGLAAAMVPFAAGAAETLDASTNLSITASTDGSKTTEVTGDALRRNVDIQTSQGVKLESSYDGSGAIATVTEHTSGSSAFGSNTSGGSVQEYSDWSSAETGATSGGFSGNF
jgi:uncharacterized protein RhaS with RHS repeats